MAETAPVEKKDEKKQISAKDRFFYFVNDIQGLLIIVALIGAFLLGHGYTSGGADLAFIIPGYICVILGVVLIVLLAILDYQHRKKIAE
ncbi:MAG: hypothetical protein LKF75_01675 [Bacilli bacterium]|jgi:hypothetical protein|nr:hypothetical protein [Bacilli bacterium]MCH4210220.1 hypothetical protein [Bacilli bacterium]MCH4228402.1 hypothetical protein [Bacilli bacterium]MCH4277911.1 hypothetical protein [Bacilli bacterium]MCI2054901.1 hypothetical protein [Bacilli bacterium]